MEKEQEEHGNEEENKANKRNEEDDEKMEGGGGRRGRGREQGGMRGKSGEQEKVTMAITVKKNEYNTWIVEVLPWRRKESKTTAKWRKEKATCRRTLVIRMQDIR